MIICNFANGRNIILFLLILSETTFQAQVEVIIAVIERNSPWSTRTWTIFHPNFNWIYLRALNFFERHDIYEEGNGRPTDAYKIWYAECFCLPGNSSLFSFCLFFYLFIFFFRRSRYRGDLHGLGILRICVSTTPLTWLLICWAYVRTYTWHTTAPSDLLYSLPYSCICFDNVSVCTFVYRVIQKWLISGMKCEERNSQLKSM